MRFGILSVLTALYFSAVCVVAMTCTPESQPNPVAPVKGVDIAGTTNGTLAIVLITLGEAQKIVGDKYKIQKEAFHEIVPAMPKNAYPALVQAVINHDVQAKGLKVPDFTVSQLGLLSPASLTTYLTSARLDRVPFPVHPGRQGLLALPPRQDAAHNRFQRWCDQERHFVRHQGHSGHVRSALRSVHLHTRRQRQGQEGLPPGLQER